MASTASYVQAIQTEKDFVGWKTAFALVKNLLKGDEKYMTVKLDNPKIQERLVSVPAAFKYLQKIGFRKDEANNVLTFAAPVPVDAITLEKNDLEQLLARYTNGNAENAASQKSAFDPTLMSRTSKSEIRAREEAKKKEKRRQEDMQRKELLKKLAADKKARQDPNWTAKVSSAMAKTGAAINKFDDSTYN
jgi:hypothetical protein|eukprot:Stramenopile-MAST_4_protein_1847